MPNSLVKAIHKQTGKNEASLHKEYKKLEKQAEKNHATNEYAYATAVLEKETHYKPKK